MSTLIPTHKQIPFRGRKNTVTQNVMCTCLFDILFTFFYAGWYANDSSIFVEVITNPNVGLPHPPLSNFDRCTNVTYLFTYNVIILNAKNFHFRAGKYYVVDAGYNMPGYLMSYKGQGYHLEEYRGIHVGLREEKNYSITIITLHSET